jgi:hypothetical protein
VLEPSTKPKTPWYFVDTSKGVIHIDQGLFLLDFEPKSIHGKPILEKLIREHQHHSNHKANQTPSSLP